MKIGDFNLIYILQFASLQFPNISRNYKYFLVPRFLLILKFLSKERFSTGTSLIYQFFTREVLGIEDPLQP